VLVSTPATVSDMKFHELFASLANFLSHLLGHLPRTRYPVICSDKLMLKRSNGFSKVFLFFCLFVKPTFNAPLVIQGVSDAIEMMFL
jgi:hypothetical protein